mmetsp:Transcript_60453/g.148333  ORF Transcript_60453/g.148333 Transcript_60453/m.148333 type:complete len:81 (-) Transcript_60453:1001-1243(-)
MKQNVSIPGRVSQEAKQHDHNIVYAMEITLHTYMHSQSNRTYRLFFLPEICTAGATVYCTALHCTVLYCTPGGMEDGCAS